MKILVTGANGFVGKNLVSTLRNIKDGKDRTRSIDIEDIYTYDLDNTIDDLRKYTSDCDFVFHLAGINRPKDVIRAMLLLLNHCALYWKNMIINVRY